MTADPPVDEGVAFPHEGVWREFERDQVCLEFHGQKIFLPAKTGWAREKFHDDPNDEMT